MPDYTDLNCRIAWPFKAYAARSEAKATRGHANARQNFADAQLVMTLPTLSLS